MQVTVVLEIWDDDFTLNNVYDIRIVPYSLGGQIAFANQQAVNGSIANCILNDVACDEPAVLDCLVARQCCRGVRSNGPSLRPSPNSKS